MPIFLVTNKVTHARMVCLARDADEASTLHPTCDTARRSGNGWTRDVGGHFSRSEAVPPPESWPHELAFIHVDMLARSEDRLWSGTTSVLAFQPDMTLRHEGEGPAGWGGYTLDALAMGARPRE